MNALERITATPLKADRDSVRIARDGYHVATVSRGMNDREEYARLFAASPAMLAALKAMHALHAEAEQRFPSPPDSRAGRAFADVTAAIALAEGGQ